MVIRGRIFPGIVIKCSGVESGMFEGMNTIYQGETLHLFAWVPSAPWNLEENFGLQKT